MVKQKNKTSIIIIVCMVFFFCTSYLCFAQILIEDSDGKDLLLSLNKLYKGGVNFSFNPKDKSVKLRLYLRTKRKNLKFPVFHSFELKGKANKDIADIIDNKKINPGVSFAYRFTKTNFLLNAKSDALDWFSLKAGYEVDQFNMFNADSQFSDQLTEVNFNGLSLTLNYALLLEAKPAGNYVVSLTAGYRRAHNYGDLLKVEIEENNERTFVNSETNSERIVKKSKTLTAGEGQYIEFDSFPVEVVFGYLPTENEKKADKTLLGYAFYTTRNFNKIQDISNLGFNLYITKANKKDDGSKGVRSAIAAIFVESRDIFNEKNSDKNFVNRIAVGLTLNFSLFKF
jgi:hypothetical protein